MNLEYRNKDKKEYYIPGNRLTVLLYGMIYVVGIP